MDTQPLEVSDFGLGITDFYIDGAPQEAQHCDNLVITANRKIKTRRGSQVLFPKMPIDATPVNKISALQEFQFFFQGFQAFYFDILATAWVEITGPNTPGSFFPTKTGNLKIVESFWRNHIFFACEEMDAVQKFFFNEVGEPVVRNAGMPLIKDPTITPNGSTGNSYLYTFIYRYTYMNKELEFISLGPTSQLISVASGEPAIGDPNVITFNNTIDANENWDVDNFEIDIYRTSNNGTTSYLVATVPRGTVSYSDTMADSELIVKPVIYTDGDVPSYDTPPKCKFVHVVNDVGYYAHCLDGAQVDPTVVRQSIPGIADACPVTFYANAEQEIYGLSSIYDRPLVFCEDYIYRIDSLFDGQGGGAMRLTRIDDTAGIVSNRSIVRTPLGLFWAGKRGIYWTDGLQVKLITPHLPETYKFITRTEAISGSIIGTYDKAEQHVLWTCAREAEENDALLVLNLRSSDFSGPRGAFTTWSGGENFRPSTIYQIGDDLYRGDTRGYVLAHLEDVTTDPVIDPDKAIADWDTATVMYKYWSTFLDFGSKMFRKFIPRILISADNTTNLSLAIQSSNDNNKVIGDLKPIRYTSNLAWGDILAIWGDSSLVWNGQGLIEEWRRFPAGGLRCNYKQIRLSNANTQIISSDLLGPGDVNYLLKTVTLDSNWPEGLVGYNICLQSTSLDPDEQYNVELPIIAHDGDTITYADPDNRGPVLSGSYKFIVRGYPKGQILGLNGYVIHWSYISKSQTPFSKSSLGSNPA